MNEICTTIGIPLEILGFTDGYNDRSEISPVMYIYKQFSDLKVNNEDLVNHIGKSSAHMNGNPDGENILWSYDRLIKRKEKKKIFMVMSDGAPAASKSSYGLTEFTSKAIKEIEDAKRVHIMGLGICTDSVKHFYKNYSIVNSPKEVGPKLLELFEKEIIS